MGVVTWPLVGGWGPCEMMFIDGSHWYLPALADLVNFEKLAAPPTATGYGHLLVADDFSCAEEYCRTVRRAWYQMVSEGRIRELGVVLTEDHTSFLLDGDGPRVNGMVWGVYTLDG